MRITFLGTGTSRGIPVIGCDCAVCQSPNPKNKRLRSSILIESRETAVVIDTSVDFRTQMLRARVSHLDAVVITHSHVDHILGLDDVYPFNIWSRKSMPVYASPATLRELRITFRYLFQGKRYPGIPSLELLPIEGNFQVGDLEFEPIEVLHGKMPVLGFRLGNFAYITDVSEIPDKSLARLKGVTHLALGGLRYKSHFSHFSLDQAAEMATRLGAQETYLVHMCHDVEHAAGNLHLPAGIQLAYDGLVWEVGEAPRA